MQPFAQHTPSRPWNSGAFGKEYAEAMLQMRYNLSIDHPFVQQFIPGLREDVSMPLETHSDDEVWDEVLSCAFFTRQPAKIQMARFFTFIWNLGQLIQEWSARLMCGKWIAPKLDYILERVNGAMEDSRLRVTCKCIAARASCAPRAIADAAL